MAEISPELINQLIAALGQQQSSNIESTLKPRGKIAKSPSAGKGLQGWYDLNPQAKPGESYSQERVRVKNAQAAEQQNIVRGPREQARKDRAAGQPQGQAPAKAQSDGGFFDMLKGLFAPQPSQQGPRINKTTGLPFGTMPGDPAYLDMQVKNAPRAQVVPTTQTQDPVMDRVKNDPAIQNLLGLSNDLNSYASRNAFNQYPDQMIPDAPPTIPDPYEGLVPMPVDPSRFPVSQQAPPFNWNSINSVQDLMPQQSPAGSRPQPAPAMDYSNVRGLQDLFPGPANAPGYGAPPLTEWLPSLGLPNLPQRPMAAAPTMPKIQPPKAAQMQTVPGNVQQMPNMPVGPVGSWPTSEQIMQEILAQLNQPKAYNGTTARPKYTNR
jgi:hypothetical protein